MMPNFFDELRRCIKFSAVKKKKRSFCEKSWTTPHLSPLSLLQTANQFQLNHSQCHFACFHVLISTISSLSSSRSFHFFPLLFCSQRLRPSFSYYSAPPPIRTGWGLNNFSAEKRSASIWKPSFFRPSSFGFSLFSRSSANSSIFRSRLSPFPSFRRIKVPIRDFSEARWCRNIVVIFKWGHLLRDGIKRESFFSRRGEKRES